MVINYKRLNDSTYENQYKILDKDQLINCIQGAKIFDCKSGFWHVKMDDESIPWIVFTCPNGQFYPLD